MTKLLTLLILIFGIAFSSAQTYKPYVLGATANSSDIAKAVEVTKDNLKSAGFQILGSYTPSKDNNRHVVVVTSADLIAAVKKAKVLTGFAAAFRIGLTKENGKVLVTYMNPPYWGNAYFQANFTQVKSNYDKLNTMLKNAMKGIGTTSFAEFGSEEGMDDEDLQEYHYMFGMPYFEDIIEIKSFKSLDEAVAKIESNFKKLKHLEMVYKISVPGTNLTLFGVGVSGEDGEENYLPTIDISNPKHTAFLPYELLVNGKDVVMLHGRYRIAISFPDLSMGQFMKIVGTPGDYEDTMEALTK